MGYPAIQSSARRIFLGPSDASNVINGLLNYGISMLYAEVANGRDFLMKCIERVSLAQHGKA